VPKAIQPLSAGIRPDTPRPLPAPIRPTTLRATGVPPPIWRRCVGSRLGSAIARAVKSLTTTKWSNCRRSRMASIENCQW
jgi:hypothetical protein